MRLDKFQRLAGPCAGAAGFVHARETRFEFREFLGIERGIVAAGDAVVGAQAAKLHAPDAAIMPLILEPLPQYRARGSAGATSVSVGDRAGIYLADSVDFEQETTRAITAANLCVRSGPGSKRQGDCSVGEAGNSVF